MHRIWLLLPLLFAGCAENPADSKPSAVVSTATALPTPVAAAGGKKYTISSDTSKVEWVGSKVTGKHDGGFKKFSGEISVVDGDPTRSSVAVEIDTTSVFADDNDLVDHLKTGDFFEVDKFPTAKFVSTGITKDGDKYQMAGDLELHGTVKGITFPADITVAPDQVTARAEFSINRFDWGILYKGKADNLIRKEVVIKLDLNAPATP
ncbi:MAG: YceI family protein [Candidatus Eremiobacteraeota bacterium]|nr:YceI family protein [Candidatus Eremiobacteraeota bacterium]MCW5866738.1 YceI family protein [Candidatus Eremiobacteraeota bacterium]